MELSSVQVETMDEHGHVQAATIPISAFAAAKEPDSSLATFKPLAPKPSQKFAASTGTRQKKSKLSTAHALPPRPSVLTSAAGGLEPHKPVRKSAKSARPAELQSIPKQSKADLINWSTTASANKRLKTCGATAPLFGMSSLPAALPSGSYERLQAGSSATLACKERTRVRPDQLPASLLRPFWPIPSHLLPQMECSSHRSIHQLRSSSSSQQSQHNHQAVAATIMNASEPAGPNLLASHAAGAADIAVPDATTLTSAHTLLQVAGSLQEPLTQLPPASRQDVATEGLQKQGVCTAADMDTAAQGLAALLQGPQPLLSGVLHAFGHAICACSAVFPDCVRAQRRMAIDKPDPQEHCGNPLDRQMGFIPEHVPLAPLWLSAAALARSSLSALLHLAGRVDKDLCKPVEAESQQQMSTAGAQQTYGQEEKAAGDVSSASAARQGLFLEQLRRHLHVKSLASLAAVHCHWPRNVMDPAQLLSSSAAAAAVEPQNAQHSTGGLAAAHRSQHVAVAGSPPMGQGISDAAYPDDKQEEAPAAVAPCQGCLHANSSSGIQAEAVQGSNSGSVAAPGSTNVQPTSSPATSAQLPSGKATVEANGHQLGSPDCKAEAADHGAEQDAASAAGKPRALSGQPPPEPLVPRAPDVGNEDGLQGAEQKLASRLAGPLSSLTGQPQGGCIVHADQADRTAGTPPACLPTSSAPAAQPALAAGFVSGSVGDADKAGSRSSSRPSVSGALGVQHAAALCLASGSLCRLLGNRQVSRLLCCQPAWSFCTITAQGHCCKTFQTCTFREKSFEHESIRGSQLAL